MKIISVIQNKGGVGKTTIIQNLAICLATQKSKKVGLIDSDSQANLSFVVKNKSKRDLKNLLINQEPITINDFSETDYNNLSIIPNKKDINSALFNSISANPLEQILSFKNIVEDIKGLDYLIIDTPPALDTQTLSVMIASHHIIIPIAYDVFSAIGLSELNKNIKSAQKMNKELDILGILLCKVHEGRIINKEMSKPLKDNFGDKLFKSTIKINTKFQQSQLRQTDIFSFEKSDWLKKGSKDILSLTKEILNKLNKK